MKAMSIRQPWLHCILHLGKDVENRGRRVNYRGPVLLHAPKGCTEIEYRWALDFMRKRGLPFAGIPPLEELQLGALLGVAELVDCTRNPVAPTGWLFEEQYGLLLRNVRQLARPVPCPGAVWLFDVPDDAVAGLIPAAA